ncbi:MFS transporter, partial [Bacillus pseudomycoides]|nr:MFS transporter [Bacillus pseudomycoides]
NNFLEPIHENIISDLIQHYTIAIQDLSLLQVVFRSTCIFPADFSFNSHIGIQLSSTFNTINVGYLEIVGVSILSIL